MAGYSTRWGLAPNGEMRDDHDDETAMKFNLRSLRRTSNVAAPSCESEEEETTGSGSQPSPNPRKRRRSTFNEKLEITDNASSLDMANDSDLSSNSGEERPEKRPCRTFACPVSGCHCRYTRRYDMKVHFLAKHIDELCNHPDINSIRKSSKAGKKWKCPFSSCNCGYSRKGDLKGHLTKKHPDDCNRFPELLQPRTTPPTTIKSPKNENNNNKAVACTCGCNGNRKATGHIVHTLMASSSPAAPEFQKVLPTISVPKVPNSATRTYHISRFGADFIQTSTVNVSSVASPLGFTTTHNTSTTTNSSSSFTTASFSVINPTTVVPITTRPKSENAARVEFILN